MYTFPVNFLLEHGWTHGFFKRNTSDARAQRNQIKEWILSIGHEHGHSDPGLIPDVLDALFEQMNWSVPQYLSVVCGLRDQKPKRGSLPLTDHNLVILSDIYTQAMVFAQQEQAHLSIFFVLPNQPRTQEMRALLRMNSSYALEPFSNDQDSVYFMAISGIQ